MITQELMEAAMQERLRETADLQKQRHALSQLRGRAAQAAGGLPPRRSQWLCFISRFTRVLRERREAANRPVDFGASRPSS